MTPGSLGGVTPSLGMLTPGQLQGFLGTPAVTPRGPFEMPTPMISAATQQAIQQAFAQSQRFDREIDERNGYLSDEDLDAMLPPTGYKILKPPENYHPTLKSAVPPTPGATPGRSVGYSIPLAPDMPIKQDLGLCSASSRGGYWKNGCLNQGLILMVVRCIRGVRQYTYGDARGAACAEARR